MLVHHAKEFLKFVTKCDPDDEKKDLRGLWAIYPHPHPHDNPTDSKIGFPLFFYHD